MKKITVLLTLLVFAFFAFGCVQNTSVSKTESVTNESLSNITVTETQNISTNASQKTSTNVTIEISGFAFVPKTITISEGTTITWVNKDNVMHTATADDGTFDSGTIGPGKSWSKEFNKRGTYSYYCAFHPFMKGVIVVQ
jgi:plastocyanin